MSESTVSTPAILDLGDRHYWTEDQLDLILQKFAQSCNPKMVRQPVFWNAHGYLQLAFQFHGKAKDLHETFDKYSPFGRIDEDDVVRPNGLCIMDDRTTLNIINELVPSMIGMPGIVYTRSIYVDNAVMFHVGQDGKITPDLYCYKMFAAVESFIVPKDGSIGMVVRENKNGFVMATTFEHASRKTHELLETNGSKVVITQGHVACADDAGFEVDFFIP